MVNDAGTLTAVVLPAQALQLTAIPDYPLRGVWPGPSGEQAHTRIIGAAGTPTASMVATPFIFGRV